MYELLGQRLYDFQIVNSAEEVETIRQKFDKYQASLRTKKKKGTNTWKQEFGYFGGKKSSDPLLREHNQIREEPEKIGSKLPTSHKFVSFEGKEKARDDQQDKIIQLQEIEFEDK